MHVRVYWCETVANDEINVCIDKFFAFHRPQL